MRKIGSVILITGILIVVGFFVYQHMRGTGAVGALETIIPDDAIYYFYSYAPSKKLTELYHCNFYRKLANLSAYKQLTESSLSKKEKIFSQTAALFDSDTALAVFSVEEFQLAEAMSSNIKAPLGKFLLFIRTSAAENIKTILGDFFLRASEKQDTRYERYSGINITHYVLSESNAAGIGNLSYTQLGDVLVIGNDQERLKKAIELFKGNSRKSLANNEVFQTLERKCAPAKKEVLLWNIINYKKYYSKLIETFLKQQSGGEENSASASQVGSLRNFLESFMGVIVGVGNIVKYDDTKQGLMVTTYQLFDATKDENGFLETFAFSAKQPNPVLAMVPNDAIGYMSFCGNMNKYFSYFKRFMNSAATLASSSVTPAVSSSSFAGKAVVPETVFGLNLEKEILPLLGENFSVFLSDIEEISTIPQEGEINPLQLAPAPIPQIFFVVEAKDTAAAERLQTLAIDIAVSSQSDKEKNSIVQKEQMYNDVTLHIIYFEGVPAPSVCFIVDKYFVFGTSLAGAKKIIDTRNDIKNSLAADLNYPFDEKQLLQNGSYVLFLDFNKLITKIAATKFIQFIKPTVGFFSQGKVMPDDVDAIFDVLDDIKLVVQANRISSDNIGEGLFYIGVSGL